MSRLAHDLSSPSEVLAKTWRGLINAQLGKVDLIQDLLKTCQDLRLDLRPAKSKKWHDQSSDTVLIQNLKFYWISTD